MNKKLKLWELNRSTPEAFKSSPKMPICVLLDDVRSFENVGSVFRTSDAFCIQELILCGITPVPPHREIHKTALGATETVTWSHEPNILTKVISLKEKGFQIIAIEQTEKTLGLHRMNELLTAKVVFIFGNEVNGVNQEVINLCDGVIEIPQFGTKHSLNISVCAGIVLWEASKLLNPILQ